MEVAMTQPIRRILHDFDNILADQQTGIGTLTDAGKRWAESKKYLSGKPIPQANTNLLELF
jgi:hypothetical protein